MKIVISQHQKEESVVIAVVRARGIACLSIKLMQAVEIAESITVVDGYTQVDLVTINGVVAQWTSEYGWGYGKELANAIMHKPSINMAAA